MDNNIIDKRTKGELKQWEQAKGTIICNNKRFAECLMYNKTEEEAEANAAFIVKACNEYTGLVEAKEKVIETLWNHYKTNGGYTRMAKGFIEKITGEKWERDSEYDNLKEQRDLLLQIVRNNVIMMDRARHILQGKDGGNWVMLDTKEAKEAINKCNAL